MPSPPTRTLADRHRRRSTRCSARSTHRGTSSSTDSTAQEPARMECLRRPVGGRPPCSPRTCPLSIVPLDATEDVPVPADLPTGSADVRPAARTSSTSCSFATQPASAVRPGQQLWDELAALDVHDTDLPELGRIATDPSMRLVISSATMADDRHPFASSADRASGRGRRCSMRCSRGDPARRPFQPRRVARRRVRRDGPVAHGLTRTGRVPTASTYKGTDRQAGRRRLIGLPSRRTPGRTCSTSCPMPMPRRSPPLLVAGPIASDATGPGRRDGDRRPGRPTRGPVCSVGTWPDLRSGRPGRRSRSARARSGH